jgi:uncharacterized MnhB-related membrane protein
MKNYKIYALVAMGITSFVMLIAEADSLGALAASKAVGALLAYATYKLGKRWNIGEKLDKYIKE